MIHSHSFTIARRICLLAAGGGLIAAVALSAHAPIASTAAAGLPAGTRITVHGGGDVSVAPDMATVTFGVQLTRASAQAAQQAVNGVIAAAVANVRALHIPDRQIQTASISLQPHYDNAGTVTGYDASQTVAVVVYRLSLAGPAIDAGVSAHANNDVSITYGLRDENAARTSALAQAITHARARAGAAATALGVSLAGASVQMSESSTVQPPQPVSESVNAPRRSAAPTQTYSGTLTVHEDVTLTYHS